MRRDGLHLAFDAARGARQIIAKADRLVDRTELDAQFGLNIAGMLFDAIEAK